MKQRTLWPRLGAALMVCAAAAASHGSFHLMQVEQVIGGVNGDNTAQAVQLRMRADFQNLVANARLRVSDATGSNPIIIQNLTTNVANGTTGARVLICTASFAALTSPPAAADFVLTNIPPGYLNAGTITFENNLGTIVYWRVSWGGAAYTGSGAGSTTNDADGNFNPPVPVPLDISGFAPIRFTGPATALSTNNAADYAVGPSPSVWINNAGAQFVLGPAPNQACCFPDGTCADLPPGNCTAQGGMPRGPGSACATTICAAATEACCDGMNNCSDVPPAECLASGRTPLGPGTSCDTSSCPTRACCLPNGSCFDGSQYDCFIAGGFLQPEGSTCDTIPSCPVLTQACCFPDGTCEDRRASDCIEFGGVPRGPGTFCTGVKCPLLESCCLPDGTCENQTVADCIQMCGLPGGPDSSCTGPDCCAGDINHDGVRDLGDIAAAIQGWGAPYGLCHVAAIIQNWAQPCVP